MLSSWQTKRSIGTSKSKLESERVMADLSNFSQFDAFPDFGMQESL